MVTMVTDSSAVAWIFDENQSTLPPIATADPGVANNLGTLSASLPLGTIVRAKHATFGEGEFIYLKGVASNAVGYVVIYVASTGVTTAVPVTANLSRPVAVSMSTATASQWGWFQISGSATCLKSAVKMDPTVNTQKVYISGTAGRVMPTSAAGRNILGAVFESTTTVTSTTSTAVVTMNRPHCQGPIT